MNTVIHFSARLHCLTFTVFLILINVELNFSQTIDSISIHRINLTPSSVSVPSMLTQIVNNSDDRFTNAKDWYNGSHKFGYDYSAILKRLNSNLNTKIFNKVEYIDFFCILPKNELSYHWILVEEWKFPDEQAAQKAFEMLGNIENSRIFFKYPIYWTFRISKSSIIFTHSEEVNFESTFYIELIQLIADSIGCDDKRIIKYKR